MGGLIDADEHAVDRPMRRHAKGHGDMATRLGAIVIGNGPSHREVGSYTTCWTASTPGPAVTCQRLSGLTLVTRVFSKIRPPAALTAFARPMRYCAGLNCA